MHICCEIKGDFAYFPIKDIGAQLPFRIWRFKSAPSVFYGELTQMIQTAEEIRCVFDDIY